MNDDVEPRLRVRDTTRLPRVDDRLSRSKEVLGVLRASIVRGDLLPGSMHSVASLAEELGVSRTPVREALIELASYGMVRFERNRGVRIVESSIHDLEEIFEVRRILEPYGAARAAERITPKTIAHLRELLGEQQEARSLDDEERLWDLDRAFHHAVLRASGNRRLADYVDHLRDQVIVRDPERLQSTSNERSVAVGHAVILESLERRDADGAAAAALAHVEHTYHMLIAQEREFEARSVQVEFDVDGQRRL